MAKYDSTKFYWLQLKEDFFDDDAIDWLEEQPNGKEYSLFYLKLCLKSLRSNGVLIRRVGNMLVPYDHVKLGELTKTSPDTVMVAMNLLIQIGLVHKLENGELYLTQVEHMIGSQSKSAFKKQQQRLTKKDNLLLEGGQWVDKCPPDIEIDIEIEEEKDREIDIEIETEEEKKKTSSSGKQQKRFSKPSIEEIRAYCEERQNNIDAERFFDYYEAIGWKVGKNTMKDWKACIRTWERNQKKDAQAQPAKKTEDQEPTIGIFPKKQTTEDYGFNDDDEWRGRF